MMTFAIICLYRQMNESKLALDLTSSPIIQPDFFLPFLSIAFMGEILPPLILILCLRLHRAYGNLYHMNKILFYCNEKGSWVGWNFCPTKIFGYTLNTVSIEDINTVVPFIHSLHSSEFFAASWNVLWGVANSKASWLLDRLVSLHHESSLMTPRGRFMSLWER